MTALTAAVVEAAEEYATTQPGGRLAVPMLVVLDEAANVCRWKNLPDLYSHYGSRGIPIMSLFQSWSQGQVVFGREGMRELWSASNVKLYLGGISEADFLRELSELTATTTSRRPPSATTRACAAPTTSCAVSASWTPPNSLRCLGAAR